MQKKIIAFGSPNIIELLQVSLGKDYLIENANYQGTIHYSRRRLFYFLRKILTADIVYFVGISDFTSTLARFAKLLKKKIVYHWLGTDVWSCLIGDSSAHKHASLADLHLAYAVNLQDELKSLGIKSNLFTLVPEGLVMEAAKMPKEHAVLLSIPDKQREFYGYSTFSKVIQKFPNLRFCIVRSSSPELYPWNNVDFRGIINRQEMDELFNEISIVIRYPDHDGLSLIMMEATIKGKYMIYRFDHPFAKRVTTIEEICSAISEIILKAPEVQIEASNYGIENYNLKKCREIGISYISKLIEGEE